MSNENKFNNTNNAIIIEYNNASSDIFNSAISLSSALSPVSSPLLQNATIKNMSIINSMKSFIESIPQSFLLMCVLIMFFLFFVIIIF